MTYLPRNIEKSILNLIKTFRIIGLTGPRQSGKSTTIKKILGDNYEYITFDRFESINEFQDDPQAFISRHNKFVIFDEVQNVPELFSYLKVIVDNEPDTKGRFVLTGSNQFTLNKNITESLAGRIGLVNLLPLDFSEVSYELKDKSVFNGSYPELITNKYESSQEWFESYVTTYIERDVRKLQNVGDLRDFQRFMTLIAGYAGKQINLTEVSKQIGISITTVKRWLSVLEASYIIFFLSPYYKNFNKRITKTPKLYFYDTGLALFLMGMYGKINFESNVLSGQLFENYIVSEIVKLNYHLSLHKKIYYYRTSGGREADLLIESGQDLILAEIKMTSTYNPKIAKELELIEIPSNDRIIIYRGEDNIQNDKLRFVNYKDFLNPKSIIRFF